MITAAATTVDLNPELYTLSLGDMMVEFTNIGASIVDLRVPGRLGPSNVVLRYSSLTDYASNPSFLGCIAGRYANRIAGGFFQIDGITHNVDVCERDKGNCLHGGSDGFHKAIWKTAEVTTRKIKFTLNSPDGDQGFPGNLCAEVTYELTEGSNAGELVLRATYEATTDKPTIVNLTNHSYFNLDGVGSEHDITGQLLTVHADFYTPVDERSIPIGEFRAVHDQFDLTSERLISGIISQGGEGLDHNFQVRGEVGTLRPAAQLYSPQTGRKMEVWTSETGVQVYMANHMNSSESGPNGTYPKYAGICFETQLPPDAINQPGFPNVILRPGETYKHVTEFRFRSDPAA